MPALVITTSGFPLLYFIHTGKVTVKYYAFWNNIVLLSTRLYPYF